MPDRLAAEVAYLRDLTREIGARHDRLASLLAAAEAEIARLSAVPEGVPEGRPCPNCEGEGCEEGCGTCWRVNAGPNSHRVCRLCRGAGLVPLSEGEQP